MSRSSFHRQVSHPRLPVRLRTYISASRQWTSKRLSSRLSANGLVYRNLGEQAVHSLPYLGRAVCLATSQHSSPLGPRIANFTSHTTLRRLFYEHACLSIIWLSILSPSRLLQLGGFFLQFRYLDFHSVGIFLYPDYTASSFTVSDQLQTGWTESHGVQGVKGARS